MTGCGGVFGLDQVVTVALVVLAVLAAGVLAIVAAAIGEIRAARRRSRRLRATLDAMPRFSRGLLRAAMGGDEDASARPGVPGPIQRR